MKTINHFTVIPGGAPKEMASGEWQVASGEQVLSVPELYGGFLYGGDFARAFIHLLSRAVQQKKLYTKEKQTRELSLIDHNDRGLLQALRREKASAKDSVVSSGPRGRYDKPNLLLDTKGFFARLTKVHHTLQSLT